MLICVKSLSRHVPSILNSYLLVTMKLKSAFLHRYYFCSNFAPEIKKNIINKIHFKTYEADRDN